MGGGLDWEKEHQRKLKDKNREFDYKSKLPSVEPGPWIPLQSREVHQKAIDHLADVRRKFQRKQEIFRELERICGKISGSRYQLGSGNGRLLQEQARELITEASAFELSQPDKILLRRAVRILELEDELCPGPIVWRRS